MAAGDERARDLLCVFQRPEVRGHAGEAVSVRPKLTTLAERQRSNILRSFPRKRESRSRAQRLRLQLWVPAFAGTSAKWNWNKPMRITTADMLDPRSSAHTLVSTTHERSGDVAAGM